jgi:FeS assembly SUF system protein
MSKDDIVAVLKTIYDPEIPVNIYDLGLIYGLDIDDHGVVSIQMTLTSPGCPVAGVLVDQVIDEVERIEGVRGARVDLVWEPQWSRERMSEDALLELGLA